MSDVKELKEKLFIQRKNGLLRADDAALAVASLALVLLYKVERARKSEAKIMHTSMKSSSQADILFQKLAFCKLKFINNRSSQFAFIGKLN